MIPESDLHRSASRILTSLTYTLYSQDWFYHPVSKSAIDMDTYCKVVQNPICILDVQKKLDGSQYGSFADFVDDVRLIFSNAALFNYPTSKASRLAGYLARSCDTQVQAAPNPSEDPRPFRVPLKGTDDHTQEMLAVVLEVIRSHYSTGLLEDTESEGLKKFGEVRKAFKQGKAYQSAEELFADLRLVAYEHCERGELAPVVKKAAVQYLSLVECTICYFYNKVAGVIEADKKWDFPEIDAHRKEQKKQRTGKNNVIIETVERNCCANYIYEEARET